MPYENTSCVHRGGPAPRRLRGRSPRPGSGGLCRSATAGSRRAPGLRLLLSRRALLAPRLGLAPEGGQNESHDFGLALAHGRGLAKVPADARRKRIDVGEVEGAEAEDADVEVLRIDALRKASRGLAATQYQNDVFHELLRGGADMPP